MGAYANRFKPETTEQEAADYLVLGITVDEELQAAEKLIGALVRMERAFGPEYLGQREAGRPITPEQHKEQVAAIRASRAALREFPMLAPQLDARVQATRHGTVERFWSEHCDHRGTA